MTSPVELKGRLLSRQRAWISFRRRRIYRSSSMVGTVGAPARTAAPRIESAPLHRELGNARDGLADAPRLLRGKLVGADRIASGFVAAVEPRQRDSVGVLH